MVDDADSAPVRRRLTQSQRRAQTRSRVLDAAATVFAQRGFSASTVDEIAEAAGVSKGAVYYSFASKDDLFLALLDERVGQRVGAMRATPESPSLQAQAEYAATGFFADLDREKAWVPLLLEFLTHAAREPAARAIMSEHYFQASRSAVAEVFQQRVHAAGVPISVPLDAIGSGISALAEGLAIAHLFIPDEAPEQTMTLIVGLILDGVIARASTKKKPTGNDDPRRSTRARTTRRA